MSASTGGNGVIPRTLPSVEYAVRVAGWSGGIRVVPAFDASRVTVAGGAPPTVTVTRAASGGAISRTWSVGVRVPLSARIRQPIRP